MRIYFNSGNEVVQKDKFMMYLLDRNLELNTGSIIDVSILERKTLSNKGNALDGMILTKDGYVTGLNIGRNPIGTGYENYSLFLEEMRCRKVLGLYDLKSLIGKPIIYFTRGDNTRGYASPFTFSKREDAQNLYK